MNQQWHEFLIDNGALIEDNAVKHFGNPEREAQVVLSGPIFADLSHYGLIQIQGEDATEFMQGQFTNDARQVSTTHSQISGYCNPKGRLLAVFRIFSPANNRYLLSLPRSILPDTVQRLRMYILRSRVEIQDVSDDFATLGIRGDKGTQALGQITEALPDAVNASCQHQGSTLIQVPDRDQERFVLYGSPADIAPIWRHLDVHAAPVGHEAWDYLDLIAGIPVIHAETVDTFIPQTVNLDCIGGISFKKGCYTGQEIVARLQYRGTLKRRMYHFTLTSDQAVTPGTAVYNIPADKDQAAGHVVTACRGPDGEMSALVSLQIHACDGALHLNSAEGPALLPCPLPYPF